MEDYQEELAEEVVEDLPKGVQPYSWYIGLLGDGTYRFITARDLATAEQYIGKHGGGIYTHAGYLIFASSKSWYNWLTQSRDPNCPEGLCPPDINVSEIECSFSPDALAWLEENEELLASVGGKYYENIPKH